MGRPERRRAQRMPVCATVEVVTRRGALLAEMQDLSRPGIRLRLRRRALGLSDTGDLARVMQQLDATLGTTPTLLLAARDGSDSVEKRVRVTRIALPMDGADTVEVGCRFEVALDAGQIRALGLTVPAAHDLDGGERKRILRPPGTVKVPRPKPPVPPATGVAHFGDPSLEARVESEGSIVSCSFRALLSGTMDRRPPAILCQADQCSRAAVRVRMSRTGYEGMSVAEAAVRLTERHGTDLQMKLMAAQAEVWSGPVQLYSVEITGDAHSDVLLTFAFDQPLSDDESTRLGLAA